MTTNTPPLTKPPYRRALLMAGGGLRFGYYLGIYQALCDTGRRPDLVIGNCGGAMATALLLEALSNSSETSRQSLIAVMNSRLLYETIGSITDKRSDSYGQYLMPALKRWCRYQLSHLLNRPIRHTHLTDKLIGNLTHHAIGHVDGETHTPCWRFDEPTSNPSATHVLILASQLSRVNAHHQWQGLLWTSNPLLWQTLEELTPTNIMARYSPLICADYHLANLPLSVMVRASITDMYYLPPLYHDDRCLMGGVMDLTPIELACQLADVVYAEPKSPFDHVLAEPAIHHVFGFSPNARLQDVHDYMANNPQIRHLDTKDYRRVRPLFDKKPNLRQGRILAYHHDFDTFVQITAEQFAYGYDVGLRCDE